METTNSYTSSSESVFFFFFVEQMQNDTFTTCCDIFSLIPITFHYLEHPWVVNILLLVFLRHIVSAFSKVNKLFRNMMQAPWLHGYGWQNMRKNMDRYLESFPPPMVCNFTSEQVQDPDEVIACLKKRCPSYSKKAQLNTLC